MRRALPILLALAVAPGAQASTPTATAAGPVSVYRIDLAWDIPVSVVAGAAILVPYSLTDSIIHPSCPCSSSDVPAFDRWAIGFASDAVDTLSTVTAGLAMIAPLAVDLADVGPSIPFLEDSAVFAETLLVNGALVTLAKYTVQRPFHACTRRARRPM